jgi:hypothetical protein
MENTFYNKARLKHSVWIAIALFFVLFYSCPVKKYIQIRMGQVPETTTSSVFVQSVSSVNKICNINRHALSQRVILANIQHNTDFDLDILFLLSSLLSFLGLLYLRDDLLKRRRQQQALAFGPPIPLYLQIRKLQV